VVFSDIIEGMYGIWHRSQAGRLSMMNQDKDEEELRIETGTP
jgi:hypothetical protein